MEETADERPTHSGTATETATQTATEAALEEAERRFHAVFDVNPAPALIIRLFGERVELVNSGFADLTGYSRPEVQGRSLHELGLFADKQAQETLLEAPRHLRSASKVELRLTARSGDPKTVLASAKALDYNGQTCAILTFADITEQKQAEAHFTKLFHVSPVPSCLVALDTGRFANANRSFLELTGYNEAELFNRTGSQLGLWSSEARARLQDRLAGRSSFRELELELRTKAGETRLILAFGEVLDDDVDLLLLIAHDVTERRRTEARLRRAVQEVMDDASSFSQQVMERFVNLKPEAAHAGAMTSDLSARERQVLSYIARGSGNDLIAAELGLAVQTVRNYVSAVYDKLGVRTRVEAAVWARERGFGDD